VRNEAKSTILRLPRIGPYHILSAPVRRDATLISLLDQLDKAGVLKTGHLFPSRNHHTWFKQQLAHIPAITLHLQRAHIPGGIELHLALQLPSLIGTLPLDRNKDRVILIGQQRGLIPIAERIRQVTKADVQTVWSARISGIAPFLSQHARQIDDMAIQLAGRQARHSPKYPSLKGWVQELCLTIPLLERRIFRRLLLGTRNFTDYARMLGYQSFGDSIIKTPKVLPRPNLRDFHEMFTQLSRDSGRCLFMHWTRAMQESYPYLQNADLRDGMFGSNRFEPIGSAIGLRRVGQWLHTAAGIDACLQQTTEGKHEHDYPTPHYANHTR